MFQKKHRRQNQNTISLSAERAIWLRAHRMLDTYVYTHTHTHTTHTNTHTHTHTHHTAHTTHTHTRARTHTHTHTLRICNTYSSSTICTLPLLLILHRIRLTSIIFREPVRPYREVNTHCLPYDNWSPSAA